MIYDEIKNAGRYRGISENLDIAIGFLERTDLNSLPLGRTQICGDRVFANVMEAQAKDEEELCFEIHRKYMDIQIDLEGTENILIGLGGFEEKEPFDPERDFGSCTAQKSARMTMGPGRFIVCMAEEPHLPGAAAQKERRLKKCVIKVAAKGGGAG